MKKQTYPGQQEWVAMMMKKNPTPGANYYSNLYAKAVTSPGFSGRFYAQQDSTPTLPKVLSAEQIQKSLLAYNKNVPLANQGQALNKGMQTLAQKTKINPIDLLTFLLRESQAGLTEAQPYNPGNVRDVTGKHGYVSYPSYDAAINGGYNPEYGVQSKGIVGTILEDPRYKKYRETGDTNEFNAAWTPEADNNPPAQVLTDRMTQLQRYFK
ncbi:hypothetical protein M0R04_13570 [Candidatus Dojkabacteria bacterium]|jgi:hypothetical protein|nr:hypothetical protein [Candidatus Dojkabacteria bacterium]